MLRDVPPDKPVSATVYLGDHVSYQEADAILAFLKLNGRQIKGVNQVAGGPPIIGVMIYNGGPETEIVVGPD